LLLAGIPNLNLLYEGEDGIAVCHEWEGKYIIHSELWNPSPTFEDLKAAKRVSNAIDKAFKARGISKLHTWAEDETQKKYNLFLGFKPTGRIVNSTFVDKDYPNTVYEYEKDLR
jgi:hypothetical protein